MAERRIFTKKVTDDDNFMQLSASAQALYLHLSMAADDDGFCNQVSISMFKAHASVDDLKVLLAKNYVIRFESGVIVIKHWRMHNTLRKDRYTPTSFQEELKQLGIKDNGSYTLGLPSGCQVVAERLPQDSIGKESIVEVSVEEDNAPTPTATKKHKYGTYKNVLLTDDEYQKLQARFPNDYEAKIETFSEAMARKGYKYKSHYLAILDWARRDAKKVDKPTASSNPFLDLLKEG
jgi:hypothetical protein